MMEPREILHKSSLGSQMQHNIGFATDIRMANKGAAWHRGCILASHSTAAGLILSFPINSSLDVAETY